MRWAIIITSVVLAIILWGCVKVYRQPIEWDMAPEEGETWQ